MSITLTEKTVLQWPDYVFVLTILLLFIGLSIYFKRRNQNINCSGGKLAEFLLASRGLSVIPAAFSIGATSISAYSLTTTTGEMYLYGVQYSIAYLSDCLATIAIAFTIVPIYRSSPYVSVFQLFEERFDGCVRRIFSFIYMINKIFYMGLVLYLPAISLTTLTPFDTRVTTLVLGFVCTAYSSLGGFRTVVWTDVIQCILLMVALLMVIIQGGLRSGSLGDAFSKSVDNGFLTAIHWNESDNIRYSIWPVIVIGILWALDSFLISQAILQRVLASRTTTVARNSVVLSGIIKALVGFTVMVAGSMLYMCYGQCNPLNISDHTGVKRIDQLFVYAIGDLFYHYPILKGVAISGIISASLSTFSSFINAFAALALEDFLKPLFPKLTQRDDLSVKICMGLSFAFGGICTIFSFILPLMGDNGVKAISFSGGILQGPLIGIAFLVLFYKRLTKKACLVGLATAMLFNSWLIIGSALYVVRPKYATLDLSTNECEGDYWELSSHTSNTSQSFSYSNNTFQIEHSSESSTLMSFYKISFMWYMPLGFFVALLMGITFSELSNIPRLVRKSKSASVNFTKKKRRNESGEDVELF